MPRDLSQLDAHFGDRFEAMKLVSVNELFWPVFRHSFKYSVRTTAPLNPIEEGLLRVAAAGVADLAEASRFLGAGQQYVNLLSQRLSDSADGRVAPSLYLKDDRISTTPHTAGVLEACARQELQEQELFASRDAIFGTWLICADDDLEILHKPDLNRDPGRWLRSRESNVCAQAEHVERERAVLSTVTRDQEVVNFSLEAEGVLVWISLSLACYQSIDARGGTFLLFNPAQDDRPLDDLSRRFQTLLEENECPPLYFSDDSAKTAERFWSRIAGAAKTVKWQEEIREQHAKRVEAEARCQPIVAALTVSSSTGRDPAAGFGEEVFIADQCLRSNRPFEASVAYRRAFECLTCLLLKLPASREISSEQIEQLRGSEGLNDKQRQLLNQQAQVYRDLATDYEGINAKYGALLSKMLSNEVWELRGLARDFGIDESIPPDFRQSFDELQKLEQEVKRLNNLIEQAPSIRYLQAADHPAILRKVLREASHYVVIISPWIRARVLSLFIEDIRFALHRGVEIWIGYGMPDSPKHNDKSDPDAITKLEELAREGKLFAVKFGASLRERGTHEKILIQDDSMCVIGSYNWLSYGARDNSRREMSILIKGQAYVQGLQSQIMRQLEQTMRGTGVQQTLQTEL